MKFYLASLAWIAIGLVLGIALLAAVKGNPWWLVVGIVAFIVAVGKIGCSTDH